MEHLQPNTEQSGALHSAPKGFSSVNSDSSTKLRSVLPATKQQSIIL